MTTSIRCSKLIIRQLSSSSSSVPSASYLPTLEVTNRVLSVVKSMKSVPPSVKSSATFSELGNNINDSFDTTTSITVTSNYTIYYLLLLLYNLLLLLLPLLLLLLT